MVIFRAEKDKFIPIINEKASEIDVLKSNHNGVADLKLVVVAKKIPIWKWNGKEYEFWKNEGEPGK